MTGNHGQSTGTAPGVSSFCRVNLEIQGVVGFSDAELRSHRAGLRFAYQMCFLITLVGTLLQSIPVLTVAATTAFFAMFPPNHPFDYVYNATIGRALNRPPVPPRTPQGRFACMLATPWMIGIITLFALGMTTAAFVVAGVLLFSAALVGFFDVCLPSMVYNVVAYRQLKPRGS